MVCFSRDHKSCFGIGRATPIHRSGPPPGSLQRVQQVRRSRSDCCHLLVAGFGVATLFHVHRTPRPSPEPEVRLLCGMLRGRGTRSPRAPLPALYPTSRIQKFCQSVRLDRTAERCVPWEVLFQIPRLILFLPERPSCPCQFLKLTTRLAPKKAHLRGGGQTLDPPLHPLGQFLCLVLPQPSLP